MVDEATKEMLYKYFDMMKGSLMLAEDDEDRDAQRFYQGAMMVVEDIKSILINEFDMEGKEDEFIIVPDGEYGYSVCSTKDYRDLMIKNRRDKLVAVGFETRFEAEKKIRETYGYDVDILEYDNHRYLK